MEYRRLKPYHGLLLLGVTLVAFIFIATPLQLNFGITGLALTEIMLLLLTAAAFLLLRPSFKKTFPLRLPPVREFFGSAFLYAGTYVAMIPSLLLIQYFFPKINEVTKSLTELGTSVSPAMAVLVVAVMPAVCEEAMHRGFILSSLKSIKSTAAVVLINGVIFGIFHLDPFRFLPTMMLGCVFAYIAIKTESMVLTMLFHFINNLFSVISMFAIQPAAEQSSELYATISLAAVIGGGLIYAAVGTVMLFIGFCILNRQSPKQITIAIVVISAVVCAAAGAIVVASTTITKILDMSGTFEANPEDGSLEFGLDIDNDGIYTVSVSAVCHETGINFTLERVKPADVKALPSAESAQNITLNTEDSASGGETTDTSVTDAAPEPAESGENTPVLILAQSGDSTLIMSQNLTLESGSYKMRISLDSEREGIYPQITMRIMVLRLIG